MKTVLRETKIKEIASAKKPVRVCMHYVHKTDPRVMRDATALVEAGFLVTIVDFESDRTKPAEENIRGVHFKHIFMPGYFVPSRFKPWFLVKLVMAMVYGTIQLLLVQADIYHAHVERALPACYLAARLCGKPFIIDMPEINLSDQRYARWSRLSALARHLIRHMVSYSAGYITASPLYPQEFVRLYGARDVTFIRNVPPYRAVTKNSRLHRYLGLGPNFRIALYQGYLQPDRGLHLLVQAAPYLQKDIVIVMLGQGEKETLDLLQSLIASEGVADRVKILPPVPYDELLEWTASADIGLSVLPPDFSLSIQKCLPNKLFEYLMAGLPVLSSKLDAIEEVITTYKVGKVVSSLSPQDLGAAINEMLADREGLARMSANALAIARSEFYWEKESQKLVDLYEEILPRGKTKPEKKVCLHAVHPVRKTPRTLLVVTALKEAGFAVSVVDIEDKNLPANEDIDGISYTHMSMSSEFLATRFRRWAFVKALFLFIRSTFLLLRTPADVYHANDFTSLPACYIAARLRRKPLIFHAHELPLSELDVPHRRRLRLLLTPVIAHMISSCTRAIASSPFYEKVLRERYHLSEVTLLRNVSPYQQVEKNDRLRQQLGLDPSVRIALYQGNIQPDRRLEIVVRAAKFLEDNTVIVMMGKAVEPTISEMKALIASEGLTDRIKILPPVPFDELLEWTASADIGLSIFPPDYSLSIRYCLPNKLFEYLMAGLPVLSSQLDAIAEVIKTYDVGKIAPSLAPEDLATSINEMLADRMGLARMSANALAAAKLEFFWEKESQKLIHLYEATLAMQSKV